MTDLKTSPSSGSFAFEALTLELRLLVAQQLEYETLRRLQSVSKSMRDLVAHPALDRAMFRAAYDKQILLSAPFLELHPVLQRLPSYNFNILQCLEEILPDINQQVLLQNATDPPCSLIYFDSNVPHWCVGPALAERAVQAGYGLPDWDRCIVHHEVGGYGRAVTVEEFINGFLDSCQFSCLNYDGMQERSEDSGELVGFRGWESWGVVRETCAGWYAQPLWERVPHDGTYCDLHECRECRRLEMEAHLSQDTTDEDVESDVESNWSFGCYQAEP